MVHPSEYKFGIAFIEKVHLWNYIQWFLGLNLDRYYEVLVKSCFEVNDLIIGFKFQLIWWHDNKILL